jgi:hypothetical protein
MGGGRIWTATQKWTEGSKNGGAQIDLGVNQFTGDFKSLRLGSATMGNSCATTFAMIGTLNPKHLRAGWC